MSADSQHGYGRSGKTDASLLQLEPISPPPTHKQHLGSTSLTPAASGNGNGNGNGNHETSLVPAPAQAAIAIPGAGSGGAGLEKLKESLLKITRDNTSLNKQSTTLNKELRQVGEKWIDCSCSRCD